MRLTDRLPLGGRTAPSRVLFGPHETDLGHRREFSPRHVAYCARRAAGGAGVPPTETASVHPDDWPDERAPLAADCGPGRAAVVLHGYVVDPAAAQRALDDGVADAVEMTRAQIADADVVAKLRAGTAQRVRPCVLCNQACQVRDDRNRRVRCVVAPRSGRAALALHSGAEVDRCPVSA